MGKLTDTQQAIVMLLVFVLPAVYLWCDAGMPTDKIGLSILLSGIISGIIVFLKEILGGTPPKE